MPEAFIGCVTLGLTLDAQTRRQVLAAFGSADRRTLAISNIPGACFVSRAASSAHAIRPGAAFAAVASLDNRPELGRRLGLTAVDLRDVADETLLLRLFERWGGGGIAHALGRFAFVYWDGEARRLTLGRDCMGVAPLLFHRSGDVIFFSNRLGDLLAIPDVPRVIDEKGVAHLLALNWRDARRTVYQGIERVPPRNLVTINRDGMRHTAYWTPDCNAPPPYARDEDYVERARELFDQAVATATGDAREVGIMLSGGLDSSAVAATVARQGRVDRIVCYTSVPPADSTVRVRQNQYRDERAKVEALGRMYPALSLNFRTWDAVHPNEEDPARFFARMSLPRPSGLMLSEMAWIAEDFAPHGILLNGSKGNFGLSWAGNYSLLALLQKREWQRFLQEVPLVARHSQRSIVRTVAQDIIVPVLPSVARLWRSRPGRRPFDLSRYSALNPDFIAQSGIAEDWAAQGFAANFGLHGANAARFRAWFLFDRVTVGQDHAGWGEEMHRVTSRDPHSDRRLLEFCLAVPEPLYRRDGVPRSFARAVFADRLPHDIVTEKRSGAQGVGWFRLMDRQRAYYASELERLEASPLAGRIIDIPRLKRLMLEWPRDEHEAEARSMDYRFALPRAIHIGHFIRWVEGGNG